MHPCRSWILVGACASWLIPLRGACPRRLQMDRCSGRGAFLRPARSGCREGAHLERCPGMPASMGQTRAEPGSAGRQAENGQDPLRRQRSPSPRRLPEQTFTGGESVPVALSLDGDLKPSWTIVWTLNGAQVQGQAPTATSFTLTDLARGVYTIEATVTDGGTGESRSVDGVTFNVMRPSLAVTAAQVAASSFSGLIAWPLSSRWIRSPSRLSSCSTPWSRASSCSIATCTSLI